MTYRRSVVCFEGKTGKNHGQVNVERSSITIIINIDTIKGPIGGISPEILQGSQTRCVCRRAVGEPRGASNYTWRQLPSREEPGMEAEKKGGAAMEMADDGRQRREGEELARRHSCSCLSF